MSSCAGFHSHPTLAFDSLNRSPKVLEPSPQRARNCPPSGASWTVSGPVGPCPASSLGVLGWGSRNPGPGPGLLDPQPTQCLPAATTASRFYRIDPAQVSSPSPSATPSIPSTGGLTRPRPCPRIGRGPALQTGVHRARPRGQGPGCPGKACCRGGGGGGGGQGLTAQVPSGRTQRKKHCWPGARLPG